MGDFLWPSTSVWPGQDVGDLDEGQLEFRGLRIGKGTSYTVRAVDGLRGVAVRSGDTPIPRGDGDTPGDHHLDAKRPVLSVTARGEYDGVVPPLLDAFRMSRTSEHPLVWREGNEELRLYVRPVDVPVVRQAPSTFTRIDVGLKASDPRVYGRARTVQLDPFTLHGGTLDYDVDYPKDFSEEGGSDVTAHNGGGSDAHPQITVSGPDSGGADGVEITNTTNGSKVTIATSIGAGQTLTVRMREWVTRRLDDLIVELDGANRYSDWTNRGEVFYLEPGDNQVRLDVLDGSEDGVRASLAWRDTWDGVRRDDD